MSLSEEDEDTYGGAAKSAASGAALGASFGPWGALAGAAVGIGLSLFGAKKSYDASKDYNAAQQQQIQLERQVEGQKQLANSIKYQRSSMENLRNAQRARASAISTGTNKGAQFGSGVAGGVGQIQSQAAWNQEGLSQNYQISQDIFGLTSRISDTKVSMANAQMNMQTGHAISGVGSMISGNSKEIGRIFSGFGNQQKQEA